MDLVSLWLGITPSSKSTSATLAGLLLERLGHIPREGEIFPWKGFIVKVARMDGGRIDEVELKQKKRSQR
ncbi:MAG: hypothetical protein II543_03565 [Desulfovibrio sp.]|nr:hypothetical protein [Desulfovibrio sp.]